MDISARHFARLAVIGQSDNEPKVARGSVWTTYWSILARDSTGVLHEGSSFTLPMGEPIGQIRVCPWTGLSIICYRFPGSTCSRTVSVCAAAGGVVLPFGMVLTEGPFKTCYANRPTADFPDDPAADLTADRKRRSFFILSCRAGRARRFIKAVLRAVLSRWQLTYWGNVNAQKLLPLSRRSRITGVHIFAWIHISITIVIY